MKFHFSVAVYIDFDFEVTDRFMDFYRNYCKSQYQLFMRSAEVPEEHMSKAWKEVAKPYKKIGTFSKEEIEKILSDKDNWTTESECVTEAAREYAAREYQDLLDKYNYHWEPEFTVEKEE